MVLNKMEEREFYVLKCKIEKGNSYFKNAELYVDAKTAMPRQLIIYGDDDSKNIEIKYKNFNYNERIEDSIFEININEIKSA
jgi:outer membrane lipoprotein-sorting protein